MQSGWILVHRKLKEHWLWHDEKKLRWWLDILLTVNHSDTKVLLKGTVVECKRGQCVKSLETWAKDWRTTKKTVLCFFKLLEKDGMLKSESVKISTRITVCNYDSYNKPVNVAETVSKRQVNDAYPQTNNGKEEIKNDEEERQEPPPQIVGFYSIETLMQRVLEDVTFIEACDRIGLKDTKIQGWLGAFNRWLTFKETTLKQMPDYKTHFINWIKHREYRTTNGEDWQPMQPKDEKPKQTGQKLPTAAELLRQREKK